MIPYHRPAPIEVDFRDIFETGVYTNGDYCRELERKLGEMYKCEALVCSSGTAAIILAIYGQEPYLFYNSSIILPAFTWFSVDYIFSIMNLKYKYTDIDLKTWLANKDANFKLHTFGNSDDSNDTEAIYDGAHSLGSKFRTLGKGTIISFAPTKLVTAGEGGVLLVSDRITDRTRENRDKCFRMSEFHAKLCLEYLKDLPEFLSWKREAYNYYKKHIDGEFQEIPFDSSYNTIGFINTKRLTIPNEIETRQYYYTITFKICRNADYVYNNIICLPSWYGVNYKKIVELINTENNGHGK